MKKTLKIGVIMDPIEEITPYKDTTLAIMLAAQARGHQLHYLQMSDLSIRNGEPCAQYHSVTVSDDNDDWFSLGKQEASSLSHFDLLLMRKDPPFDAEYIYATYILERAEKLGVFVANRPQSLRDCNEKVYATEFPLFCPPHLISRNSDDLKAFHKEHGDVIFKPLEGMGGSSIFRCKKDDKNLSVILETLTRFDQQFIMAQKFVPAIDKGDKRVLIVNGVPVDYALARIPAKGETRGNIAAGGRGVAQPLSDRDREIAEKIGPHLKLKGLYFVGLDIIGDYLTEINVTSPTCAREIDAAYGTNIGAMFIEALEKMIH